MTLPQWSRVMWLVLYVLDGKDHWMLVKWIQQNLSRSQMRLMI